MSLIYFEFGNSLLPGSDSKRAFTNIRSQISTEPSNALLH